MRLTADSPKTNRSPNPTKKTSRWQPMISQQKTTKNIDQPKQDDFLSRHASVTLGSNNLKDVVRLPQGEDQNEWIAVNISDFFRQVAMLYGIVAESCTDESCPRMMAGQKHEYFWSDSKGNLMEPCPANLYIDYLLNWVQEELDDENIFPSQIGKAFPTNFLHIARTIMKRLFRIYAHVYHHHFELVEELKAVEHLNTSFKHFILFIREFGLIDNHLMDPMRELIDQLLPRSSMNTSNDEFPTTSI